MTHVRYGRAGYQVTAPMSDLYAWTGVAFDCAKKLDSSSFSLDFVANPVTVSGVAAQASPVRDLAGTLTAPVTTAVGLGADTPPAVTGVLGETSDSALSGLYSGVEDALPVKVAAGSPGAFTTPAPHAG